MVILSKKDNGQWPLLRAFLIPQVRLVVRIWYDSAFQLNQSVCCCSNASKTNLVKVSQDKDYPYNESEVNLFRSCDTLSSAQPIEITFISRYFKDITGIRCAKTVANIPDTMNQGKASNGTKDLEITFLSLDWARL